MEKFKTEKRLTKAAMRKLVTEAFLEGCKVNKTGSLWFFTDPKKDCCFYIREKGQMYTALYGEKTVRYTRSKTLDYGCAEISTNFTKALFKEIMQNYA